MEAELPWWQIPVIIDLDVDNLMDTNEGALGRHAEDGHVVFDLTSEHQQEVSESALQDSELEIAFRVHSKSSAALASKGWSSKPIHAPVVVDACTENTMPLREGNAPESQQHSEVSVPLCTDRSSMSAGKEHGPRLPGTYCITEGGIVELTAEYQRKKLKALRKRARRLRRRATESYDKKVEAQMLRALRRAMRRARRRNCDGAGPKSVSCDATTGKLTGCNSERARLMHISSVAANRKKVRGQAGVISPHINSSQRHRRKTKFFPSASGAMMPNRVHKNVRSGLLSSLMQRLRFCATVKRTGKTRGGGWVKRTILLTNVEACEDAMVRTDHAWLKIGKQFDSLSLKSGDRVQFNARVKWYRKQGGYDLQLSHHAKLQKCIAPAHTGSPALQPLARS